MRTNLLRTGILPLRCLVPVSLCLLLSTPHLRAEGWASSRTSKDVPEQFVDSGEESPLAELTESEDSDSGIPTLLQWSRGNSFEGGPPGRDEPLVSDRPDFTEASTTVGRGVAQVEMGYTFRTNTQAGIRNDSHSYPEMLWRIGILAEWLEFRIAYNAGSSTVSQSSLPSIIASGSDDIYLGFKIGLTPQEGWLPEMALMPQMFVPTGSSGLSSGIALPGLNWLYGWDITERISCGGSTQFNKVVDDLGDVHYELAQSITIGWGLTERLGMYTEWFVITTSGAAIPSTQHYLDGGFTFSVTNDLQLDIRAGVGLSDDAEDLFAGSGFVKRF